MIQERTYDDDTHRGPNLAVIGFAEFVRRQSAKPPGGGAREGCAEAEEWGRSKEKLQQVGQLRAWAYVAHMVAVRCPFMCAI